MPRKFAKPWYRPARDCWYVTLQGKQHNLGRCSEEEAWDRANTLKKQLRSRPVSSDSLPAVIDAFLDWLKPRRSPDTFEWCRYRLERLARRHPDLRASDLTTEMAEGWVDGYKLSVTSRRNCYHRVKKCLT